MILSVARKIFGTSNERLVKQLRKEVDKINALEPTLERLSDAELQGRTQWFRERLSGGATVDDLLIEAFATVREASKRTLNMRHFDVQMIGGMVLHQGMISEMRTGEGKTLVATLAAYLNALPGKGVHVVTVNDYLATRDAAWMGKLYNFLGLSVGVVVPGLSDEQRKAAYACDITYATNNELGFDYLRDNMRFERSAMVQREFHYAIVDEVDSILIDEARTPLIISGPAEDSSEMYVKANAIIKELPTELIDIDEKARSANLTEDGIETVEQMLVQQGLLQEGTSLYDFHNVALVHHVNQAVRAHHLFKKDVDYIIKDNKVVIIDEFTGRMMEGRRYSDGLHQALEAKEGTRIKEENQTLASITFQNYFRMYPKLSGMTGTAMTEAGEFMDIYRLNVIEIPTHVAVQRIDHDDVIYKSANEKYKAVIELVKECYKRRQPVLLGTVSIEKSEYLAALLKKEKIPHQVLNARYHEQEAAIIAQAGRPGAVTIATNMAGRGTDIMLGGNAQMRFETESQFITDEKEKENFRQMVEEEVEHGRRSVKSAGGLFVIATERHESRRIDNQLRGRSGRQGDPGATKFFLSLEDDLMRIFGADKMEGLLTKLGLQEGEAIFHPWMNRAIEKAQTRVEQRNYEIRKNLLKFDDVMNNQRKVIYEQRIHLMEATDVQETVQEMRAEVLENIVTQYVPTKSYAESWNMDGLNSDLARLFNLEIDTKPWAAEEGIAEEEILVRLQNLVQQAVQQKDDLYTADLMRSAEKRVLLQTLDQLWKDHLYQLDHLRNGISLRAYGQKDPLNEYKSEAFLLFEQMLNTLRELTVERLSGLSIHMETEDGTPVPFGRAQTDEEWHAGRSLEEAENAAAATAAQNPWGKVGRNDVCPCGSGKKFKHCHGAIA